MNEQNLMKFHLAALRLILQLDEPTLPKEQIKKLEDYSHELNLQWSDNLMLFYVQAALRTCQILKFIQMKNKNED